MSWDLFIQDWGNVESIDQIPEDFVPGIIGKRSEIVSAIKSVEPSFDFSDANWGKLKKESFSIDINIGESEDCLGFVMHVYGGKEALPTIHKILDKLELKAADGSSPYFI